MKAKYEPRIDLKDRTLLEHAIPLVSPFVIFIDPSDACNFKCRFCPTSDRSLMKSVGRPWKQLSFDLFKKIVRDMGSFDEPVKVLRLYKDGEPLLNKKLPDMIRYAKDAGVALRVDTTTNASLLTKTNAKNLVDAGLDRINISIYGTSNAHYENFSGVSRQFEAVLANVKSFYEVRGDCEMLVKINGDSLSEIEKEQFLVEFGDFTDKIYIEHTMSCWPEFKLRGVEVNPDVGLYGQEIKEIDTCPYPFYSMAVNSDGLVSTCFLDWGRKLVIGNVESESIVGIWKGQPMRQYQKMFLEGHRKQHPVCGNCGQMSHGSPDNIDEYASRILRELNECGYFDDIEDSPGMTPGLIASSK